LLARSMARRREAAIRIALGSGRFREMRSASAEAFVLSAAGAAGGLLLCAWLQPLASILIPDNLRGQLGIGVPRGDLESFLFACAMALATALLCAAIPAWKAGNVPAQDVLREGRVPQPGRRAGRALSTLVVGELALALVLLSGAGLLASHLRRLERKPLGLVPRRLLTLRVNLPATRYAGGAARSRALEEILGDIERVPGVSLAAATTVNPLAGGTWVTPIAAEGVGSTLDNGLPVNYRLVTPDLFRTMGTALVSGRAFTSRDDADAVPVAILSRRLSQHLWPGQSALGKRVRFARSSDENPWRLVVGVVEDVADAGDVDAAWYLPYAQAADSSGADGLNLMIRLDRDPERLVAPLRLAVAKRDPGLAAFSIETMGEVYRDSLSRERFGAVVAEASAGAGLLLALLGIGGLAAYRTGQRRAEIAIRLALGAPKRRLLLSLLADGARIVIGGLALGAAGAVAEERLLRHLIPGLTGVGPVFFLGVSVLLGAAALAASLAPARRATRVDPVAALRAE
jgi:putative ABC transport system permease protein